VPARPSRESLGWPVLSLEPHADRGWNFGSDEQWIKFSVDHVEELEPFSCLLWLIILCHLELHVLGFLDRRGLFSLSRLAVHVGHRLAKRCIRIGEQSPYLEVGHADLETKLPQYSAYGIHGTFEEPHLHRLDGPSFLQLPGLDG